MSVITFILLKISTLLLIHFNNSQFLLDHNFVFDVVNIGNFVTLLYLLVALLMVKSNLIRLYFRWFVIIMVLAILLPRFGEILYDDFSMHWLLVNADVMTELCFVLTLTLFIKTFILSSKNATVAME